MARWTVVNGNEIWFIPGGIWIPLSQSDAEIHKYQWHMSNQDIQALWWIFQNILQ